MRRTDQSTAAAGAARPGYLESYVLGSEVWSTDAEG